MLVLAFGILAAGSQRSRGADMTWDGGDGTGATILGNTNWSTDTVPGLSDNAIFDSFGNATNLTINFSNVSGLFRLGSISYGAGATINRTIRNNSANTNGVLELNGVGGVILANNCVNRQFVLLNQASGFSSRPMVVRLATRGDIYVSSSLSSGQILIQSSIDETNGSQGFNKTGPGILYLQGTNNTFTGSITNLQGDIKVNDTATFGIGSAPFYFAGGGIISGLDRSGASDPPLANPMVLLADGLIQNDGGNNNSTRTIPFSGPFSGSVGTLTIANTGSTLNNTFFVRMSGAFGFSRPIIVGAAFDTVGDFSVLQLYNSATNGTLTLSGDISGQGSIYRQGATTSAGGTAVLSGNNSYSGGTLVTYGTLLVNNSSGTGTGSGSVTVTNQGILGGTGSAGSTTVGFGGAIAPGNSVGNFGVSEITFNPDSKYIWQINSATGTPGTAWDLITVGGGSGGWADAATSANPITIKVDSMGLTPTGWSSAIARDWVLIQAGAATGFDATHFVVDTTSFVGAIQGVFSVSVVSGSLHLIYTPASDIVLNVPTGSQSQTALGYPTLSGTFGVLKIGNGEAVFTNPGNNYVGSTKIYAGTASVSVDALNGSGAFGAATSTLLLGNTVGNSNATLNINTAGVTIGRSVIVQAGSTGVKTIGTTVTSGAITNSGDISLLDNVLLTVPSGGMAVFSGEISGTNGITKTNGGIVSLASANTYSGKTRIMGGTLTIDAVNRLGALPVLVVDDQVTIDAATLEFTASTASSGSTRGFRIGNAGATFSVQGGTLTINGSISGTGNLVKIGTSRLDLNNITNVYAGDTYLLEGDIGVDDDGSFGAGPIRLYGGGIACTASRSTTANFIPNALIMTNNTSIRTTGGTDGTSRVIAFSGSSITTSGGTLTITNGAAAVTNNTIDVRFLGSGFNFTRPIVLDGGAGTGNSAQLFVGNSNSTVQTFSGVISGNGRVRRSATVTSDAGTTVFTAANTYSGGTVVFAGTLLANNSSGSGTGSGLVTVSNAGVFGGTGAIAGPVLVQTNGTIAPGTSAGTLTLNGGLDLSLSGTYLWELAANSISGPGANYDVIAMTGGNLVLGGASRLSLNFIGPATAPDATNSFWQSPHSWTIATISGTAANPGSTKFTTIVNGTFTAGSFTNYADGSGNVILAYLPSGSVPPPVISPAITGAGSASATISWSSVNGTSYTVLYKTNLNQVGWLTLGGVTAGGPTASIQDNTGPHKERYYRVSSP